MGRGYIRRVEVHEIEGRALRKSLEDNRVDTPIEGSLGGYPRIILGFGSLVDI